jgi:hypothetical protein
MFTAQTVNTRTTFNSSIRVTTQLVNQNSEVHAGDPGQSERNTPHREAVWQVCFFLRSPSRGSAWSPACLRLVHREAAFSFRHLSVNGVHLVLSLGSLPRSLPSQGTLSSPHASLSLDWIFIWKSAEPSMDL